jgi:hypothetical protein
MKTLIKNRRSYRSRIGSPDQLGDKVLKDSDEEEGAGGNGGDNDDWEDMYMEEKGMGKKRIGGGDEDGDEDEDDDRMKDISGSEDGGEDEDGGSENGVEDDEGRSSGNKQAGMKRKERIQDIDERATATRAKRMKINGSGGHQAELTKKTVSKKVISKK